jgi:hypothetical protein
MNRKQRILCALAATPLLAVFAWAKLASLFPEPWGDRQMLGEMVIPWDLVAWASVGQEPAHLLGRLIPLLLLHLPGAQIRTLALANALIAIVFGVLLVGPLFAAFRRSRVPPACAVLFAAMLAATPSLGATWLYGERASMFVAPTLFLLCLRLLQSDRPFARSAITTVILAGIAPFFHSNGCFLAIALLPALREASRRLQPPQPAAWQLALLLVGTVAAAASIAPAGSIALGSQGILGRLCDAPVDALVQLVTGLGHCLLDPVANTDVDATMLGSTMLLLPLAMMVGRPARPELQRLDAASASCLLYGLMAALWPIERLGLGADAAALRSLSTGSCLMLVGGLGLLAIRLHRTHFALAIGATSVLLALDWQNGLETLRVARTSCELAEARLLLPEDCVGLRDETMLTVRTKPEFDDLVARKVVPSTSLFRPESLQAAANASPERGRGALAECSPTLIHGSVRSSLFGETPSIVVALTSAPGEPFAPASHAWPDFLEAGRNASFTMQLQKPLNEGTRLRVVSINPRTGACHPIGPLLHVRDGRIGKETGK